MDDHAMKEGEGGGGEHGERGHAWKRPLLFFVFRGFFVVVFSLAVSFFLSFLFGLLTLLIGSLSGPDSPVSVPAQCRVLTSGVDLRSSKVCELALSNCKAKHVLYNYGKSTIRCRDDYYWASVFKVEYREYFSGRILHGVAESPKEALPFSCRPGFRTAWLTKSKFKVNGTYQCRYSLGTLKADIYPDHLFNCQAEDPTMVEMMRRFSILTLNSVKSFSWNKVRGWHHILAAAIGIVGGILSAMFMAILVKFLQLSRLALSKKWEPVKCHIMSLALQFRRVCLVVAYISAVSWLTLQYSQAVGLKQLFFDSDSVTTITR